MARLEELHDFVRYLREVEYTKDVIKFRNNHHEAWAQYAKQQHISITKATATAERAHYEGFLEFKPLNDATGPPNKVIPHPIKGDDFLERTLFGTFPKGLFMAWFNRNYKPLTLLTAFTGGVLLTLVLFVIKWIVTGKP
jgi:hypothetical protein